MGSVGRSYGTGASLSRRLVGFTAALLLFTAGLVGLDGMTTMTTARAAGPLTGIAAPSAAYPMYSGATMLAFSAEDESYVGAGPQTFYAYTKAGEDFQAVFLRTTRLTTSAASTWYTTITVTSPSGVVSTEEIPGNAAASTFWGYPKGTLPSEEGIWTAKVALASSAPAGRVGLRSYSAVFSGTAEKRGRMWTERLHLNQGSNVNIDIPIHFMSSLGYVYRADYKGYFGLLSYISADAVGNVKVAGGAVDCSAALYRTIPLVSSTEKPALGRCGGAYRVFWQEPFQDDLPGSIPEVTAHSGASTSKWVYPQEKAPVFDLTNFVGDSDTVASGDLIASVDNFFGSVGVDVFDVGGNRIRSFTVTVPEGTLPREIPLHFDGLDDDGHSIPRDSVATFTVTGLNTGEIHFLLGDVERIMRGMSIKVLNGPTSGTAEASRIYWADGDGFDGTTANCHVPDIAVNTRDNGFLSGGYVDGFGTRCWGTASATGWGDSKIVDTWAKQGVASVSSITLHDPVAHYTLQKSVNTSGAVLPGKAVGYTLTIKNTSTKDLWDLYDVVDDLSGILDDADFNDDAVVSKAWTGMPVAGATVFDAAAKTLTFRGNIPAGQTVTVDYSATVRPDAADRGDGILGNTVADSPDLPAEPCGVPGCRETSTPVKDIALRKTLDGSPLQNADGSWNIAYLLEVSNAGGAAEPYALADVLNFGAGITVLGASATAVGGGAPVPSASWNGSGDTQVVVSTIDPGATHRYRATVTATVAAGVVGSGAASCPASGAGGFRNSATVLASSTPVVTASGSACASPSRPSLQKALTGTVQNPDGSWSLSYRLLVANSSPNTLSYKLRDVLHFAAGADVTDARVTASPGGVALAAPSWDGDGNTTIATGVSLPAAIGGVASTHEYSIVVTASIAGTPDFADAEWQCPARSSSADVAFNNTAVVASGADTLSDSACGLPVNPSVAKYISSQPAQQADGSWSLSYRIVVMNSADDPVTGLSYSLGDTLRYPTGVKVNSVQLTGPPGVALDPGFTGGLDKVGGVAVTPVSSILAGASEMVPAATVSGPGEHSFTVTVNVSVPTGFDDDDLLCDPNGDGGFLNTALMTAAANGGVVIPASDCADITAPAGASVQKSVITSNQADDGSWEIVYGLDVSNADTLLIADYTLSDVLDYGSGVAIGTTEVNRSPASVVLVSPAWDGVANTVVARGIPLPAGTVHHYEVTVVATPEASLYGTFDAICASDGTGGTGGFMNTASVSTGLEDPATASACASMPAPLLAVAKSVGLRGGNTVKVGDVVTYAVTATNVGSGVFTTINPAEVLDDLSSVLDDAGYDGNATASAPGALVYATPQLSWSGVLRSGASVRLDYSVTVTSGGDLVLRNVAFTSDGSCAVGGCAAPDALHCAPGSCALTETPVVILPSALPHDALGHTGASGVQLLVVLGLLALGTGGIAYGLRVLPRRRRSSGRRA